MSGVEKVYFTCSDGTDEGTVGIWYHSKPDRRARLLAGWRQFAEDLLNFVLKAVAAKPAATVEGVYLPAVHVRITGDIAVVDNLDEMAVVVRDFIDSKLIRKPVTDLDFVNLDKQIKGMKEAEAELNKAEEDMISQTGTVRSRLQLKDAIYSLLRENRLASEKLYEAEKTNRKNQIVQSGKDRFADHIASLNKRFERPYMPAIPVDFAAVIKGKRDLAVMENAIDTELANAKIKANAIADLIDRNLKTIGAVGESYAHLFVDVTSLVLKASEDMANVIQVRKAGEDNRLTKVKEEAEEKAKAEAEAAKNTITTASPVSSSTEEGTRETPALGQRETLPETVAAPAVVQARIAPEAWQVAYDRTVAALEGMTVTQLSMVEKYATSLMPKKEAA